MEISFLELEAFHTLDALCLDIVLPFTWKGFTRLMRNVGDKKPNLIPCGFGVPLCANILEVLPGNLSLNKDIDKG